MNKSIGQRVDEEVTAAKDAIYLQRNALAIGFAKAALAAGWKAGRGMHEENDKNWDPDWLRIVYVVLPDGRQVSWHMGPGLDEEWLQLPWFEGEWDGTFHGRDASWCGFEVPNGN